MTILGRLLDRLWPIGWQVYYGPNRGSEEYRALGAYAWGCCPCAGDDRDVGGFAGSDVEARAKAVKHARQHLLARAVYDEG